MPAALLCALLLAAGPDGPPGEVLAEAGGERITRGRVALYLTLSELPRDRWPAAWDETVEELKDRALMRRFLARRRAAAEDSVIDAATATLTERLGANPAATLAELGATETDVRAEAALPKAWEVQARRLITPEKLRTHFETNRPRFDGTALTIAQIFRPGDAVGELAAVKARIDAGGLSFSEAAAEFSEAPSADRGGAIGPVRAGDGRVPPEVSAAAFALEPGAVSDPVRSAAGTHLVTVLGVAEPGELVLEDVRKAVRRDLKAELWDEQVAKLR